MTSRCIETELGVGTVGVWASFEAALDYLDPFRWQGAPCFGDPASDEDYLFLYGSDPEDAYQP